MLKVETTKNNSCRQTVKTDTPMEVVITGKSSSDIMRGILLQARHGDEIVGTFTLNPNERFAQLLDCGAPGVSICMSFLVAHQEIYILSNLADQRDISKPKHQL